MKDSEIQKTDQELVTEYRGGDENSLSLLIKRYLTPLYNFIYRLVGDRSATDDATQETFFKAWKNIKKFREKENFKTWLFAIARNSAIDYLRKRKNLSFSDFEREDGSNDVTDTLTDVEPPSETVLGRLEDKKIIEELLNNLPLLYREVLWLRYHENCTFEDIGIILNKPLDTVKSQHRRAIHVLRKQISESDFNRL